MLAALIESLAVCGSERNRGRMMCDNNPEAEGSWENHPHHPHCGKTNDNAVQHLSIRLPRLAKDLSSEGGDGETKRCRSLPLSCCSCRRMGDTSFHAERSSHQHRSQHQHNNETGRFRAVIFAWVTSLTASVLFSLASFRCDTFQFQDTIQFGLWSIRNNDGSCRYWDTDDVWVRRGRVGSVLATLFGTIVVGYLSLLLLNSCCAGSMRIRSSLAFLRIAGGIIAIGMVGIVSLASTIVRSDLCKDSCIVTFPGLYGAAILWVATGVSLLFVPLCTTNHDQTNDDRSKQASSSATSREDHGDDTDPEDGGFAIVKTFHNGETHITETVNERDGTIRRTHIVKAADGTEHISARVYDQEAPFSPKEEEEEESAAEWIDSSRKTDNEQVVKILLSDSPQDARPVSTTIHWGSPKAVNEAMPVTYFQEPQVETEPPAPFTVFSLSQSTASPEPVVSFPCHVPEILRDDADEGEQEDSSCERSIPSTISFSKPPEDDATDTTYGPRLLSKAAVMRQDVV